MLKKLTLTLVAASMLVLSTLPTPGFADNQISTTVDNGQLLNNRVLIPLRAVSQNFGATVEWNQEAKTVTINKGDSKIMLPANFKRAVVYSPSNDPSIKDVKRIDLDAPAQIIQGTIFVPMRFVSQSLGANVTWNQQTKQATMTMNDKKIVVNMEQPTIKIPTSQILTDARLKILSDKLNEVANLSSTKNLNSKYESYFTKRLINSLVKNKLQDKNRFEAPITTAYYTSKTAASLSQSTIIGNDMTGQENYVTDRSSNFVFIDGVWKVDEVSFTFRSIPNLGY